MTKNVKSKKLIAAGLLSAAVLCFGGAQVVKTVSNGNVGTAIVRAYAETEYEVWQENIAILDGIDYDALDVEGDYDSALQETYNAYVTAYINAADVYGMVVSQATAEEKATYQAAYNNVNNVAYCYNYMSVTLPAKLAGDPAEFALYWSDKADYDNIINQIEGQDEGRLNEYASTYVQNVMVGYAETKDEADAEFERLDVAIQDAIAMIDAIEYVGMVDSESSISDATDALESIYGIDYNNLPAEELAAFRIYVENLDSYEEALEAYNEILEACEQFDAEIVELYEKFTEEEGEYYNQYYLNREDITDTKAAYDDLAQEHDDRRTLINEYEKLKELCDTLNDILDAKAEVEELIADIPEEYDYTDEYIGYVEAAEEIYAELPEDLKDSGDVEGEDIMFAARENIDVDAAAVEALVQATYALIDLWEAEDASFSAAVQNASTARAALTYPKQVTDYDNAPVDPAYADKDNCKDLLKLMQTRRATLIAKITPVIDAINAIGDLEMTNQGIANRIAAARELYDALTTDLERNSIYNYETLLEAEEWLANETAAIDAWADAVEAIEEIINTDDLDAFAEVEETYEAFDVATKDFINENQEVYPYGYYLELLDARDILLGDVEYVAGLMAELSTDIDEICEDPEAFEESLLEVADLFDSFDESVQERYFTDDEADYSEEYANYVAANGLYENVVSLVCKIIALGDGNPLAVTMAEYDGILEDLEEYEALDDEYKAIIDEQGAIVIEEVEYDSYKARLDAAKDTIDEKKADRDEWIDSVYALAGGVEKEDWETDLYNVDLDALATVVENRDLFNEDGDGDYLAEADEDLFAIFEIAYQRIADLIIAIDELPEQLTDEDIPTLKEIKATYDKLHATQQEFIENYEEFEEKYNTYVTSSSFDELIENLYNNVVVEGDYTKQVPINVALLREIYKNLTPAAQAMVTKMDKLDEIEAAYEAYNGVILDLTSVNTAIRELITAIAEQLAEDIETAQGDIEEIFDIIGDEETEGTILAEIKNINEVIASLIEGLASTNIALIDTQLEIATYNDDDELVGGILYDIQQLEIRLNTAIANAVNAAKAELNNNIIGAVEQLNGSITAAVNAAKTELNTAIANAVNAAKQELNNRIDGLENKTAEDTAALENRVKTLEIEAYILIAAVVLLAGVDVVFFILRKKA